MRHDQVRDLIINLLTKSSCKILCMYHISHLKKPNLICVRGVHNSMGKTFYDVRVFHSSAATNQCQIVEASCKKHENEKKRTFNARVIEVEKETFNPLVFSTTCRMWKEANRFLKRVTILISYKKGNLYNDCVFTSEESWASAVYEQCWWLLEVTEVEEWWAKTSIATLTKTLDMPLIIYWSTRVPHKAE